MLVDRLDYTENRDGGITENSMYFLLKYICVIKPYMGSVLLLQINYCRDMIYKYLLHRKKWCLMTKLNEVFLHAKPVDCDICME